MSHYYMPELGESAEDKFRALAENKGYIVRHATRYEDRRHVDFFVTVENRTVTIDVKSMKKINRADQTVEVDTIWVEFKNGDGYPGWLYGETDYIAFEMPKSFLIVKRCDLLDLAQSKVKNVKALNARDALYKIYTRRGRMDKVSRIKVEDIRGIEYREWKK